MTSFALALEPAATPRLAAIAFLAHLGAAASPWLARVAPPLAATLSLIAVVAFAWTLSRIPGRHAALSACEFGSRGWRIRLRGSAAWLPAQLVPASRAYAAIALLELTAGGRRYGWLLPCAAVPPGPFRRLKARIRLSC